MCWAHTERAIEIQLRKLHDKKLADNILSDIRDIQHSHSFDVFALKNEFFFAKYKSLKNKNVDVFFKYYRKEWFESNLCGWYVGRSEGPFVPSTNNGLESVNGKIKSKHKMRTRQVLRRFLGSFVKFFKRFSTSDFKEYVFDTSLTADAWINSSCYLKTKPKVWKSEDIYYFANDKSVDEAVVVQTEDGLRFRLSTWLRFFCMYS